MEAITMTEQEFPFKCPKCSNPVESINSCGETLLHVAAQEGNEDAVIFLLKHGLSLDSLDESEWTPLHHSVFKGHLSLTKLLIAEGGDVNTPHGTPPLQLAAERGDLNMVKLLLSLGAEVDRQDKSGWTALYAAVERLKPEIVVYLLSSGANANVKEENGWTALDRANESRGDTNAASLAILQSYGAKRSAEPL